MEPFGHRGDLLLISMIVYIATVCGAISIIAYCA